MAAVADSGLGGDQWLAPPEHLDLARGVREQTTGYCEQSSFFLAFLILVEDRAKLLQTALEEQHQQFSHTHSRQQSLLPIHVLRDVSAGLAHLHSHGVVHRDVKPANVLLRGDEQVKLCDFGSSRDLEMSVQQMSVAGTLGYMAPEVLKEKPSGRPVDV